MADILCSLPRPLASAVWVSFRVWTDTWGLGHVFSGVKTVAFTGTCCPEVTAFSWGLSMRGFLASPLSLSRIGSGVKEAYSICLRCADWCPHTSDFPWGHQTLSSAPARSGTAPFCPAPCPYLLLFIGLGVSRSETSSVPEQEAEGNPGDVRATHSVIQQVHLRHRCALGEKISTHNAISVHKKFIVYGERHINHQYGIRR